MERTVILIKPDAVKKGAVGEIIARIEKAGFKIAAAKFIKLTDEILDVWYAHHKDKQFFPELKVFMKETPVMAVLWEGNDVVAKVRELCGPTDSKKAAAGTIRGDFGTDIQANAIHASESSEAAQKETTLIFSPEEIFVF